MVHENVLQVCMTKFWCNLFLPKFYLYSCPKKSAEKTEGLKRGLLQFPGRRRKLCTLHATFVIIILDCLPKTQYFFALDLQRIESPSVVMGRGRKRPKKNPETSSSKNGEEGFLGNQNKGRRFVVGREVPLADRVSPAVKKTGGSKRNRELGAENFGDCENGTERNMKRRRLVGLRGEKFCGFSELRGSGERQVADGGKNEGVRAKKRGKNGSTVSAKKKKAVHGDGFGVTLCLCVVVLSLM